MTTAGRNGGAPTAGASVDTIHATIQGLDYAPARIEVPPGTTIVWTNEAPLAHTVTANDGAWGSPMLESGAPWSHTFTEPGAPLPLRAAPFTPL